jgi:hypothetical protein
MTVLARDDAVKTKQLMTIVTIPQEKGTLKNWIL